MKASICISAYNKPNHLEKVLTSIYSQSPTFDFETIVVDDGGTLKIGEVCSKFPIQYVRIERLPGYRNPAKSRNRAYRLARGKIIIAQSDDVIHHSNNCIQNLIDSLSPGTFVIGSVTNVNNLGQPYSDPNGKGYGDKLKVYTSPQRRRPLFFLGSLYRKDLYRVGGNDEEFVHPTREDVWFALCLMKGLGLIPHYSREIVGHHLHHTHCLDYGAMEHSNKIFKQKLLKAQRGAISYESSGGVWEYLETNQ